MIVGASCTAELIQDDPAGLIEKMGLPIPVIPLELPSYQRKEHWGAAETFYQIVRHLADKDRRPSRRVPAVVRLSTCLGQRLLGFRHRDDVTRNHRPAWPSWASTSTSPRRWAPMSPTSRTPGRCRFQHRALSRNRRCRPRDDSKRDFGQPVVQTVPIGVGATRISSAKSPRWPTSIPQPMLRRRPVALVLVAPLGRFQLSHRQARLRLRRRHACRRRGTGRSEGTRLQGRRHRHLQPRIRARRARRRQALRRASR